MSNKPLLDVKLNSQPLQQALDRLQSSVTNTAPLMRQLAGTLLSVSQQNFMNEGHPPWTPSLAAQKRSGQTLTDSGHLLRSIQAASDDRQAMAGTNVVYAAIHQLGGKTRPHIIKPKHKKALAFGGLVRKSVNHPGSNIPARPFLPVNEHGEPQPGLEQTLLAQTENYLRRAALGEI